MSRITTIARVGLVAVVCVAVAAPQALAKSSAKGGTANTLSLGPASELGYGWAAALAAAIATGMACGFIQGSVITRLKVPPFVVTLGGLTIFRGLTLTISTGGPISGFTPDMRWW